MSLPTSTLTIEICEKKNFYTLLQVKGEALWLYKRTKTPDRVNGARCQSYPLLIMTDGPVDPDALRPPIQEVSTLAERRSSG